MSKYYKEEDLQRALIGFVRETGIDEKPFEYAANVLDNLQTIEVSEEQLGKLLGKLQASENSVENTTASEDFTSISRANSKLEVSEDCISREYMKSLGYINKGDFNSVETIREWIDNAPSVVPKARPIEIHLDVTDDVVDRAVEQICGAKMKG